MIHKREVVGSNPTPAVVFKHFFFRVRSYKTKQGRQTINCKLVRMSRTLVVSPFWGKKLYIAPARFAQIIVDAYRRGILNNRDANP